MAVWCVSLLSIAACCCCVRLYCRLQQALFRSWPELCTLLLNALTIGYYGRFLGLQADWHLHTLSMPCSICGYSTDCS